MILQVLINLISYNLDGGFKYVLFSSLFGEDEPMLTNIFQMGWFNHQPVTDFCPTTLVPCDELKAVGPLQ